MRTIIAVLLLATFAFAANPDEAGVRAALDAYLQGHATGDGAHFRRAFHPDARMWGVRDGKLVLTPIEEYIARAPGKPAYDEAQRKRSIESIDITGNTANAKIVLDYPHVKFTDYMSLMKVGDEWKIVNKIYFAEPRKK